MKIRKFLDMLKGGNPFFPFARREVLQNKIAVVTGGSSGIGKAVSVRLVKEGVRVCIVSNVPSELDETASIIKALGGVCLTLDIDLSVPDRVAAVIPEVERNLGPVDILVNNAGMGLHKSFSEITESEFRLLFEVNFFAAVSLCRAVFARMASRRTGCIVNVSSASARRALPFMTAYGASKGALHTFSQALRLEAAPYGVKVIEILPISVSTKFFDRAGYRPKGLVQSPEFVANLVLMAIQYNRVEVVTSKLAQLAFVFDSLCPNFTSRLLEFWYGRYSVE